VEGPDRRAANEIHTLVGRVPSRGVALEESQWEPSPTRRRRPYSRGNLAGRRLPTETKRPTDVESRAKGETPRGKGGKAKAEKNNFAMETFCYLTIAGLMGD